MDPKFARFFEGDASPVVSCGIRFLLAAILSGSQLSGGCTPFGLGVVAAAGAGMQGLSALLGLLAGSLLFMELGTALKYIAIGVLIFSVSVAFYDTRIYRSASFMPAVCAMCTAAVGFVYLMGDALASQSTAFFVLEVALSAVCAACARTVLEPRETDSPKMRRVCFAALSVFVLIAAAAVPLSPYMSLGRVLTVALTMFFAYRYGSGEGSAAGLAGGIAMDVAAFSGGGAFYCAAYGLGAALSASVAPKKNRLLFAALFMVGAAVPLIFVSDTAMLWSLPEAAVGCVIFLLLPTSVVVPAKRLAEPDEPYDNENEDEPAPETLRQKLLSAADAFRALYDDLSRSAPAQNDENIASVFDRAADHVCRRCAIRGICWEKDYVSTYNALNNAAPAINERGKLMPADLPTHFTARCISLADFIAAVNAEFGAMLIRRQYGKQLDDTRRRAKLQYAQMSELLTSAAKTTDEAVEAAAIPAQFSVGASSSPKDGETVSGDTLASFDLGGGKLFLMLSDGMGCGESARRESAMTVRLMERFVKSGIEPDTALRTLNSAMTLHSDESGGFTTIDLLYCDIPSGTAVLYKYGAAPTYIRHAGVIRRVSGSALPAGLSPDDRAPEKTELHLSPGDAAVMVSDGVVGMDNDGWLREIISEEEGTAKETAERIVREGRAHTGRSDDSSALVLYIGDMGRKV